MKKMALMVVVLTGLITTGQIWAEYTEDFIKEYGLQGGTTEQIMPKKETTINGKKYKIKKANEEVTSEDVLFNIKVKVKEGTPKKEAEKMFKKNGCKVIQYKEESRLYFIKKEKAEFSDKNTDIKIGSVYNAIEKEEIVSAAELNYLTPGSKVEYISGVLRITVGSKITKDKRDKIFKKYGLIILEQSEDEKNKYLVDIGKNTTVPKMLNQLIKEDIIIDAKPEYLAYIPEYETKPNDISYSNQWYLNQPNSIDIDMPEAWSIIKSTVIVRVAIIDTGIDMKCDDLLETVIQSKNDSDEDGHGTVVAGIIGAETNNGIGISGICWNGTNMIVSITSIKIVQKNKVLTIEDVVEGLRRAIKSKPDIINMSLNTEYTIDLKENIDKAISNGITIVASAGNKGIEVIADKGKNEGLDVYPGAYERVINVGSADRAGIRTKFSNYGERVDVYAPGEDLYTTTLNNKYKQVSGTSDSAAIVTGIVALMKSEKPGLTSEEIKTILKETIKNNMVNAYNAMLKVKGIQKTENITTTDTQIATKDMGAIGIKQGESTGMGKGNILDKEKNSEILLEVLKSTDNTHLQIFTKNLVKNGNIPVQELAKYYQSSDRTIRINTIQVLGEIENKEALVMLEKALKDEYYKVRMISYLYLKKKTGKEYTVFSHKESGANKIIIDVLKSYEEIEKQLPEYGKTGYETFFERGMLAAMGEATIPQIIKSIQDKNKNKAFRKSLVYLITDEIKISENKVVHSVLIKIALDDTESDVIRDCAVTGIGSLNSKESLPQLKELQKKIGDDTKNKRKEYDVNFIGSIERTIKILEK